jgi:hypothetical protein
MIDDSDLLRLCDTLDDLEKARIAGENRLRSLATIKGHAESPEAASLEGIIFGLKRLEKDAIKTVERAMKQHPRGNWVTDTPGLGLKTVARLVASIGDPTWNFAEDRPRRGVAELWAYCGYHVIDGRAPHRARGQKANWNPDAKMRVFLVAESCIKQDGKPDKNGKRRAMSPYREVYDDARAKYATATHDRDCKRCGPAGKPAPAGSELSDAHKHARAMRIVCKEIMKDLFNERAAEARTTDEVAA